MGSTQICLTKHVKANKGARPKNWKQGEPEIISLVNAGALREKPVHWLIRDWIARGKFSLIAGPPETGKTGLACAIASIVTRGSKLPGGQKCTPGHVVYWSGEDDIQDTILPRLRVAGADLDKIAFPTPWYDDRHGFDPSSKADLKGLHKAMTTDLRSEAVRPSLLILDPVASVALAVKDANNPLAIRSALDYLVRLAEETNIALVGITHTCKGAQFKYIDPVDRVLGSSAWVQIARTVMLTEKVAKLDGFLLHRAKCNLSAPVDGIQYTIGHGEHDTEIMQIQFGQTVQDPGSYLAMESSKGQKRREAAECILRILEEADGYKRTWDELLEVGKQDGHREGTLVRARKGLKADGKIMDRRTPNPNGKGRLTWWYLCK